MNKGAEVGRMQAEKVSAYCIAEVECALAAALVDSGEQLERIELEMVKTRHIGKHRLECLCKQCRLELQRSPNGEFESPNMCRGERRCNEEAEKVVKRAATAFTYYDTSKETRSGYVVPAAAYEAADGKIEADGATGGDGRGMEAGVVAEVEGGEDGVEELVREGGKLVRHGADGLSHPNQERVLHNYIPNGARESLGVFIYLNPIFPINHN
jgi:hypothetical protein